MIQGIPDKIRLPLLTSIVCWLAMVSYPDTLWGQKVFTGSVVSNVASLMPQERIMVHTDKPYYLAGETLWFTAYCSEVGSGKLSGVSRVVYVEILDQSSQVVNQMMSEIDSGIANGQVMLGTDLSTGVYWLRAYTAWMRNGEPDNFYQQALRIINPLTELPENLVDSSNPKPRTEKQLDKHTKYLEVTTDQDSYHLREAVNLKIGPVLPDSVLEYQLSVSVYPFHQDLEMGNSAKIISHSNQTGAPRTEVFLPETTGPIIYGQLQEPMDELMVSIGGSKARLYQVLWTGPKEFLFQLSKEVEYQQLYFWSTQPQHPQVNLRSAFDPRPVSRSPIIPKFDSATIEFIENQSVNVQVSNIYSAYNNVHGKSPGLETQLVPFYGTPEFQYQLDDYTRFPSLEETFREYVRYMSLRRTSSQLHVHVWDHYANNQSLANNIFFDNPALVLLDGIPIQDIESLLALDPLKIKSIEIVTKKYLVGDQSFDGVVNLSSYDQNLVNDDILTNLELVPFQDLERPLEFHHPTYTGDSTNARIPDRRNTLFWHPRIKISHDQSVDLQFFTGDITGVYQIEIYGVTSSGQSIHHTSKITIEGGYQ